MADMEIILERDPDQAAAYMIRGLMFANLRQWDLDGRRYERTHPAQA